MSSRGPEDAAPALLGHDGARAREWMGGRRRGRGLLSLSQCRSARAARGREIYIYRRVRELAGAAAVAHSAPRQPDALSVLCMPICVCREIPPVLYLRTRLLCNNKIYTYIRAYRYSDKKEEEWAVKMLGGQRRIVPPPPLFVR